MASFPLNPVVGDKHLQGSTEYVYNSLGCWDVNGTTGFDIVADKADKFGSNLNRFKVANAVSADEAVSKGQLFVATVNDLLSLAGMDGDTVIVSDKDRGGTFIYDSAKSSVNDEGVIFNGWIRQYSGAVNVKWFGAKDDLTFDSRGSFVNAFSYLSVDFDDTINGYYISEPIESVQGLSLRGINSVLNDLKRKTSIYAPKGFMINDVATRHRIKIDNLHIYGNNNINSKGFYGAFGGNFNGNFIEKYDILIHNTNSFLSYYINNKFGESNQGLFLIDANEVVIEENWFSSDSKQWLNIEGNAFPIIINKNNFNSGSGTTTPSVLTGQVIFKENYVELFSQAVIDYIFEYNAGRFKYSSLDVTDNHINGQNNGVGFIHIYSDNAAGSTVAGQIKRNWLRGFTMPIKIGGKAGAYDLVKGIDISDNQASVTQYVEYESGNYAIPYRYILSASYSGSLDISSSSYVIVPYVLDTGFNGEIADGITNINSNGLYQINITMEVVYNAEYRSFEFEILKSGEILINSVHTLGTVVGGGNNYATLSIGKIVYLNTSDDIYFQARNGETILKSTISIVKIDEPMKYISV